MPLPPAITIFVEAPIDALFAYPASLSLQFQPRPFRHHLTGEAARVDTSSILLPGETNTCLLKQSLHLPHWPRTMPELLLPDSFQLLYLHFFTLGHSSQHHVFRFRSESMATASSTESGGNNSDSGADEKPQIQPLRLPTAEEIRGQDIWNNCAVRSFVSGVMGNISLQNFTFLRKYSQ
ncbi:hypothetical protein SAY86_012814 [Trapa natans]|uniref:Uncharacterized protein n=1 Tax=Trapa natans TaxID=22666 RepID=A0AAN7LXP6_TRANT|nr:hypothetical protein SAY86_012814 [Trapa natans]